MLALLSGNIIAPHEVKVKDDQPKRALEELAASLDFPSGFGTDVFDALGEARKAIKEGSSWMLQRDDRVWFLLCELEAQIAYQLQNLSPLSDVDARSVKALERMARALRQAIEYLVDHELAPLLP